MATFYKLQQTVRINILINNKASEQQKCKRSPVSSQGKLEMGLCIASLCMLEPCPVHTVKYMFSQN